MKNKAPTFKTKPPHRPLVNRQKEEAAHCLGSNSGHENNFAFLSSEQETKFRNNKYEFMLRLLISGMISIASKKEQINNKKTL